MPPHALASRTLLASAILAAGISAIVPGQAHAFGFCSQDSTCNPMYNGKVRIVSRGDTTMIDCVGNNCSPSQPIHLLASPSGLAHDGQGYVELTLWNSDSAYFDGGNGYGWSFMFPEVWLTPGGNPPGVYWLQSNQANGNGTLVCCDPEVSSALELSYFQFTTSAYPLYFRPKLAGHGPVHLQIKMQDKTGLGEKQYGPIGDLFSVRSTDVDADGDCDEDDEADLRAALGSTQTANLIIYDLDWSDTVDTADLEILLIEARRKVTGLKYCTLDDANCQTGGDGPPNTQNPDPLHLVPPATITNLSVTRLNGSTVRLSWTAPADDGASGRPASAYDVRSSSSPITSQEMFDAADPVSSPPTPGNPGATETLDVSLTSGQCRYFAVRAKDDVDNWSALGNSAKEAPLPVSGITSAIGRYTVKLGWAAPGDCGNTGTAAAYDIRYVAGASLTEANWASATPVASPPAPSAAGSSECIVIESLEGCTQYSFGLKTQSVSGQWSALSEIRTVTTKCSGTITVACGGGSSLQPATEEEAPQAQGAPRVLSLSRFMPNPTSAGGQMSYGIPADRVGQHFDLGVFDVSGRRLATLADGPASAGSHRITWDLRSNEGTRLRPGVYFVRLRLGDTQLSQQLQVAP